MFREQLHESFDNISPSPELLDRISAMMQEEVSRPKPPIRMQAVRYGGIAAAVLITAGAAIAAVQINSGKNSITSEAAPASFAAKKADDGIAMNGIMPDNDMTMADAPAADAEAAAGAEFDEAAENEALSESYVFADAVEKAAADEEYDEAAPEMTAAATTTAPVLAEGEAAAAPVAPDTEGLNFIQAMPDTADNVSELYAAEADDYLYDEKCEDADFDEPFEPIEPTDPTSDAVASGTNDAGSAVSLGPALQWANPRSGEGTDWDLEPTDAKFYMIPLELQICADGAVKYTEDGYIAGDRWKEYVEANHTDFVELTSIDKGINVFTFIKYFNINGEYARDALMNQSSANNRYTEEEADALISGDLTVIARTFASKWAVVKGEKLYSPYWLENHSFDEWKAEGITPDDIRSRYDELTDVPKTLTDEEFRTAYKERFDRFIAGQPDNKKIERRSAPVSAADNENAIAESVVTLTNDLSDKDMSQKESAALNKEASARYAKALDKLLDDADAVPLPYSAIELSKYESMAVVSFGGVYGKCGLLGDTVYVYTESGRSGALVLTKDPYVRVWLSDNAAKELYNITCDGSSY